MLTEDDFKEQERERIIALLTQHRSEVRVCQPIYDGHHAMMSEEALRAYLAPKP